MRSGIILRNAVLVVSGLIMVWQASVSSALFDEPAHIASGLIAVRKGDTGYYKVNPPLHKLWSAVFVELLYAPRLPATIPSREFSNLSRPESQLGEDLMRLNPTNFKGILITARIVRIPVVLLGGVLIWNILLDVQVHARSIACLLWASAPLVLGHGWVVSADAFSGVAMATIVLTSLNWLRNRSWRNLIVLGFCWGIALSTKFTFCPIFVLYPLALLAYTLASECWAVCKISALAGAFFIQGTLALVIVWCAYGFSDIGVPLYQHDLNSDLLGWLSLDDEPQPPPSIDWIRGLRSPFPRSFLTGVDQQLVDMDRPRGAYSLGKHYPGPLRWYYLVGYPGREQLATWISVLICLFSTVRTSLNHKSLLGSTEVQKAETRGAMLFVAILAALCVLILSMHANMVWNIRYLFPVLPLVYILVGLTIPEVRVRTSAMRPKWNILPVALTAIVISEVVFVTPYQFSYVNPMYGGMYRNPPVFHDSNFDYGQDLWHLEKWLQQHQTTRLTPEVGENEVIILLSGPYSNQLTPTWQIATRATIRQAIATRDATNGSHGNRLLLVSRGFVFPEPWYMEASPFGQGSLSIDALEDVQELLRHDPDVFISPTLGGYLFKDD